MGATDTQATGRFRRGDGRGPDDPTDIPKRSWKGVLKRTWREFQEDNLPDLAAALTYYGILSLFPALLVLVSILGLVGTSAIETLKGNIEAMAPGPASEIAVSAIDNLRGSGTAGIMAIVGIAVALWSASNYVGGFMRASNAVYEIPEGRPFYKARPLQLAITLLMVLLVAICAIAIVVTGPLARKVGDAIGVGETAVTVFNIVKWPAIALVFMMMLAFLYYAAPNVKHPKFQWISPGSVVAVVVWLIASGLFALYIANFNNYDKTYGSLGGVIIFLTWLWISNIAVLLGAEVNAELEREKRIAEGMPPDREPFLEPRDTTKIDKERAKALGSS